MKSRSAARALFTLALCLAAASAARAQGGHTIRGKVRDAAGGNVAGLVVDLQSGNGVPVGQTTTNNEGDFFFGGLTDSSYTVSVRSADHAPASESVEFGRPTGPNSPGCGRS